MGWVKGLTGKPGPPPIFSGKKVEKAMVLGFDFELNQSVAKTKLRMKHGDSSTGKGWV